MYKCSCAYMACYTCAQRKKNATKNVQNSPLLFNKCARTHHILKDKEKKTIQITRNCLHANAAIEMKNLRVPEGVDATPFYKANEYTM